LEYGRRPSPAEFAVAGSPVTGPETTGFGSLWPFKSDSSKNPPDRPRGRIAREQPRGKNRQNDPPLSDGHRPLPPTAHRDIGDSVTVAFALQGMLHSERRDCEYFCCLSRLTSGASQGAGIIRTINWKPASVNHPSNLGPRLLPPPERLGQTVPSCRMNDCWRIPSGTVEPS
jgi:hypothetical protein